MKCFSNSWLCKARFIEVIFFSTWLSALHISHLLFASLFEGLYASSLQPILTSLQVLQQPVYFEENIYLKHKYIFTIKNTKLKVAYILSTFMQV